MKTRTITTKILVRAAIVLSLIASASISTRAADQVKGGPQLLHLSQLKTQKDLDQVNTGDTLAMVCARCKTVYVTQVKRDTKGVHILMEGGQPKQLIGTHACAGCNSTIEVVGHGKQKQNLITHTCNKCGEESAFCCATRSGGSPTKGMEKEKP